MYSQNNSRVNPGGFVAGPGFIDPNATNPGGFYVPAQPAYFNNNSSVPDKHRNPSVSTVPPYPPDNRRDSTPIKVNSNQVKNSNGNNIIQSPMNVPYPPLNSSNGYPSPINPLTNNSKSYPPINPLTNNSSGNYPPINPLTNNSSGSYPPINPLTNNSSGNYPPINPLTNNSSGSYPIISPADLQRRFYGTCKACNKPNSDFAECATCKDWILHMETMIKERKSLINQQLCIKCQLPKHVHSQIAACAKCGFPKSCLEELNKIVVKNENDSDNNTNNNNGNSGNTLICGNCNDPLANYLKCPTFTEIAQRMRKERECLPYEDPNFAKLSKIIKNYSNLEKRKDTNSIPDQH